MGGLGWILGKALQKVVGHWHRLPIVVVGSLYLGVFKKHGDVARRDVVCGRYWW